jgi:DNA modification methylase
VTVYLRDPDVTLYHGDARAVLRGLPDESVHMCVTSPPFFSLRDYGVEGQIGLEATPDEWVARLVAVFREVRRVLRRDGTLLVEVGDSYASNGPGGMEGGSLAKGGQQHRSSRGVAKRRGDAKPKDLIGAPFLLAFALRAAGWYWRGCYVWEKRNAMPESARDRCTTAHSYVLHFSRSSRYFWDADAIAEPAAWERWGDQTVPKYEGTDTASGWVPPRSKADLRSGRVGRYQERAMYGNGDGTTPRKLRDPAEVGTRNARSVWAINTEGYSGAHFAVFPEALPRRCILAGTSERGVCPVCGAPWEREVAREPDNSGGYVNGPGGHKRNRVEGQQPHRGSLSDVARWRTETLGWRPSCDHDHPPVPATVLDCFAGAGTTLLVARKLGRHAVGVELNEAYCEMISDRLSQQSLLAEQT